MKKIILSLFAIMATLSIDAQTTTEINVIRIYSSERTGDAASYPVAEYQNSEDDKYSAELLDGVITIKRTTGSGDAAVTTEVETWENTSSVKYRAELQKIKVTIDGKDANGHEYVNLGDNAGIWAKTNVGGDIETAFGNYYAWGETTAFNTKPNAYPKSQTLDWTGETSSGYSAYVDKEEKLSYLWRDYKWCSVPNNETRPYTNTVCKYMTTDYYSLETADDAATTNWGSSWCMPTKTQIVALKNYTNNYFVILNGVQGYRFVKSDDASRYVFMPSAGAVGQAGNPSDEYYVDNGYYWAKDLSDEHMANLLWFYGESIDAESTDIRCLGCSVRPVYSPE